ncbi:MAG: hypothetical protein M3347_09255, partial [Armatimonadota bacterium]|nr:hypothetical protein [Armatimonadota bacterium]
MSTPVSDKLRRQADADERVIPCPVCAGQSLAILLTPEDIEAEHHWLREFYQRRQCGADDPKDRVSFTQSEPTY